MNNGSIFSINAMMFAYFIFIFNAQSQSNFNTEMKDMSLKLINRMKEKENKKVAVWDFTDLDGNVISIGKYISEQVSDDFSNSNETFQIIDRNHLKTILKEHQLKSEGYIDPSTAKELGKFAGVDYVVTGKITVLSNHINLTIKVLSTETAMINASISGNIQMDENIKELLGISLSGNKGFNGTSLNSNEYINNPASVNNECNLKNTGDLCFTNNTNGKLLVMLRFSQDDSHGQTIRLAKDQTQCFYNMRAINAYYSTFNEQIFSDGKSHFPTNYGNIRDEGQILIEKCKSKTFKLQ
ncbi:MAG: hypothetical protein IPI50_15160 [Saprospiraceae bacterium]|nr:hypothetical protein [Saprospiraceae bacterium]